jgi:hypothetical protein
VAKQLVFALPNLFKQVINKQLQEQMKSVGFSSFIFLEKLTIGKQKEEYIKTKAKTLLRRLN